MAGMPLLGRNIIEISEPGEELLPFVVDEGYPRLEEKSQLNPNAI